MAGAGAGALRGKSAASAGEAANADSKASAHHFTFFIEPSEWDCDGGLLEAPSLYMPLSQYKP